MCATKIYSFKQLYEDLDAKKDIHLILGNGFSIAASEKFCYQSLYQTADLTKETKAIFDYYKVNNFEDVMKELGKNIGANKIVLCDTRPFEKQIGLIKELLVQTISKVHPNYNDIDPNKSLKNCYQFISKFKNIFTFNYDLLLYWVAMQDTANHSDGFLNKKDICVYKKFKFKNRTNNYYMHGAIHLFEYKKQTYKRVARNDKKITELVREALAEDRYPLVVTEGDAESKKIKIGKSDYLRTCWKRFSSIGGAVFSYGLSFCEQDSHILNSIIENKKIRELYIGYYKDKQTIENNIAVLRDKRSDLHIQFFRSEEVDVWGKQKMLVG